MLVFPDQKLNSDQLELFSEQFGSLGEDPFFHPIPGRKHIAAVKREAEDTNKIFAEFWHSDWSFMPEPPCGTVLYALDIPPHGGNTEFSNQHLSYESMPDDMRERFDGLQAIHSPKLGYSPKGAYGNVEENGAMDIKPSEEAEHMYHTHPLAPEHPETGRKGFLSGVSYIVGFEGMSDEDAYKFIFELNDWQSRDELLVQPQVGKRHVGSLGQSERCSPSNRWLRGPPARVTSYHHLLEADERVTRTHKVRVT